MERVHETFGAMVEAQIGFYANPSHETLMTFVKSLHTLHQAMRNMPAKDAG